MPSIDSVPRQNVALDVLAATMREYDRAAAAYEAARQSRDHAIRRAYHLGIPRGDIAVAAGVSRGLVHRIATRPAEDCAP
ncbi:MAG: hypothetical protein ACRCZP_06950 [Phycicoccus sp.]